MRRILIVFVAIMATSAAVGQARDEASDEAAVRDVIAGLVNAWTAGDGMRWAAAFVEDADFVVWFGLPLAGREEIAFGHNLIFKKFYANTTFQMDVKKVRFLGRDVAIVHLEGSVIRKGETLPEVPDAVPLAVMNWTNEGWRIVAFQNTPYVVDEFRANGDLKRFKRLVAGQVDKP